MTIISLQTLIPIIAVALGIAYVCTGSEIGYAFVRFPFCLVTRWLRLRFLWGLVRCPSCNAWWAGALIAHLSGAPWFHALQAAFAACGIVAYIQHRLEGDGLAAAENFDEILGAKEKENGT